jgi:hypothetical protein
LKTPQHGFGTAFTLGIHLFLQLTISILAMSGSASAGIFGPPPPPDQINTFAVDGTFQDGTPLVGTIGLGSPSGAVSSVNITIAPANFLDPHSFTNVGLPASIGPIGQFYLVQGGLLGGPYNNWEIGALASSLGDGLSLIFPGNIQNSYKKLL